MALTNKKIIMDFKIRKAFGEKYIVEQSGKLPVVYESITAIVSDMFYAPIFNEWDGSELAVHADLIFNPPTTLP